MLKVIGTIFLSMICLLATAQDKAQKYGHVNSGNLLQLLPDAKKADETLKVVQDSFQTIEKGMLEVFEKEYVAFVKQANAGELPKLQVQKKQQEFQAKEEEIKTLRNKAQLEMISRRQVLLEPILKKMQDAVDAVAKEKGFTYVFDISSGALLFANESEDIEPLVKAKLGINP